MPRKGENIYKRKDKRWEARYVREYRPDGTPKYGYCYGKTYREAKQKVMQAKADILACRPYRRLRTNAVLHSTATNGCSSTAAASKNPLM